MCFPTDSSRRPQQGGAESVPVLWKAGAPDLPELGPRAIAAQPQKVIRAQGTEVAWKEADQQPEP